MRGSNSEILCKTSKCRISILYTFLISREHSNNCLGNSDHLRTEVRQLSKFVEDKATVSGVVMETSEVVGVRDLTATSNAGLNTIDVHHISRPAKKSRRQ